MDSVRHFTIKLSATRRGARLARRLAAQQLAAWGWPYDANVSTTATQLVAELAANAVLHGRLPGRDFRLGLLVIDGGATLRIEVTDTRPERRPPTEERGTPVKEDAESGRGLILVEALSDRWGVYRGSPYTKTVWCETSLP